MSIADWRSPYSIFEHAESLLRSASTKFQLADVITNLKRCVDSRVRHLDGIYQFKKLPVGAKSNGIYDRMQIVRILKPVMMGNYEIRNAIEHRDDDPPDRSRCEELLEFAWYFLRSTDGLAQHQATCIEFNEKQELGRSQSYGLALQYPEKTGNAIEFSGWLPPAHVSTDAVPGYWKVDLTVCETKADVVKRCNRPRKELPHLSRFRKEDIWMKGTFQDPEATTDLYMLYFET